MNIDYKIIFHSYWHCGSGLAAGADVDALVIKDKDNLPYVPGKTIKGLLREAIDDILFFRGVSEDVLKLADEMFGEEGTRMGTVFFSNAVLSEKEKTAIVANRASSYLYTALSNTKIGKDGVAEEHSLRRMQVVVPCELYGTIMDIPEEMIGYVKESIKYLKRLGSNRNRGLGRCTFEVE